MDTILSAVWHLCFMMLERINCYPGDVIYVVRIRGLLIALVTIGVLAVE